MEILLDITDDMYCGSLNPEVVGNYTCMLCYGIVFKPVKCEQCETLICQKCVNPKRLIKGNFFCYKNCGSKNCLPYDEIPSREKKIMEGFKFKCLNDDCEEKIPYGKYFAHMRKHCKVQTYEKVILPEGACNI